MRTLRLLASTIVPAALAFTVALATWIGPGTAQAEPPAEGPPTFAHVAPLLQRSCTHCHGGDRPVKGLSLETHASVLKGGAGGVVVRPGAPAESPLIARLRGTQTPQMPFDDVPLPEEEIRLVERWIEAGAPAAEEPLAKPPPPPAPADDEPVTWTHVGPLLRANCVRCHQDGGLKGRAPEGIRFDTYEHAVGGRERVAVVPGHPAASPIVRVLHPGRARRRMPLDGPPYLAPEAVRLLERWVEDGARAEDGTPARMPTGLRIRIFGRYDGNAVDGAEIVIGNGSRVDDDVVRGGLVEVRGTVLADGRIRVERIRERKAEDR